MSCKLSILIPSYEYNKGVERILENISNLSEKVEIIIFDDSTSNFVQDSVRFYAKDCNRIRFRKNNPKLGAVENWNALLEAAQGEYCVLMHHDEAPLDRSYISNVLTEISRNPNVDVFLCDIYLADENSDIMRRHVPNFFRWLIVNKYPSYLIKRNVIGPTASLIVKKKHYPRFNTKLRWLVDVDLYQRLCSDNLKWRLAPGIKIISIQREIGTITSTLKDDLNEVDSHERKFLQLDAGNENKVFNKFINLCFNSIERVFWTILKIVIYASNFKYFINKYFNHRQ